MSQISNPRGPAQNLSKSLTVDVDATQYYAKQGVGSSTQTSGADYLDATTSSTSVDPQYIDTLRQYHVMYQNYLNKIPANDPRRQGAEQLVTKYENMIDQYLAQCGTDRSAWDPVSPSTSSPIPGVTNTGNDSLDFPVDYEDKTKGYLLSEKGLSTDVTIENGDDQRTVKFYQPKNTLNIPSNLASVKVEEKTDETGKKMVVVTLSFPNTNKTKVLEYHNVTRSNFKLDIKTPSPEDLIGLDRLSPEIKAKVSSTELDSADGTDATDETTPDLETTAPTKKDSTSRTWAPADGIVDYAVTKGPEKDILYAKKVTIAAPDATYAAEVTKTGATDYQIVFKNDKNEVVRTTEVHRAESIDLGNMSLDQVSYKDGTVTPAQTLTPLAGAASLPSDSVLQVGGKSLNEIQTDLDKKALEPAVAGDTVPTSREGGVLIYSGKDVTLHANMESKTSQSRINATGIVKISPNSSTDTVNVRLETSGPYAGQYVIDVIGKNKAGATVTQTFFVNAKNVGKIVIDSDNPNLNLDLAGKGKVQVGIAPKSADWSLGLRNAMPRTTNWHIGVQLADKINEATKDPTKWAEVTAFIKSLGGEEGSDAIRQMMTAIFRAAGNIRPGDKGRGEQADFAYTDKHSQATALLKLIPESVRIAMKDKVGEADRGRFNTLSGNGDMGNNEDSINLLSESLS